MLKNILALLFIVTSITSTSSLAKTCTINFTLDDKIILFDRFEEDLMSNPKKISLSNNELAPFLADLWQKLHNEGIDDDFCFTSVNDVLFTFSNSETVHYIYKLDLLDEIDMFDFLN